MIIEKSIRLNWCDEDLKATPNGVDIWEKDGKFYFTWEAAIREAEAQGLRVPTKEEWEESFGIIWEDKLFDFLKLNLSGYRNYSNGYYGTQGSDGYYWSSTPNGTDAYIAYFYSGGGYIANFYSRGDGFSVRCLKG